MNVCMWDVFLCFQTQINVKKRVQKPVHVTPSAPSVTALSDSNEVQHDRHVDPMLWCGESFLVLKIDGARLGGGSREGVYFSAVGYCGGELKSK